MVFVYSTRRLSLFGTKQVRLQPPSNRSGHFLHGQLEWPVAAEQDGSLAGIDVLCSQLQRSKWQRWQILWAAIAPVRCRVRP